MLCVTNKPFRFNVVMLSVVAPRTSNVKEEIKDPVFDPPPGQTLKKVDSYSCNARSVSSNIIGNTSDRTTHSLNGHSLKRAPLKGCSNS